MHGTSIALAEWAARIRDGGYGRAFVFFKHEDEGAGPRMAQAFLDAWAALGAPARVAGARGKRGAGASEKRQA